MTLPSTPPSETKGRVWPWFAAVAGLLVLDQVSKALVRQFMDVHQSIPILGDFFRLTYVLNPGYAFGMRTLGMTTLIVFGWAAALILVLYLVRLARQRDPLRWPVMLFLAGAVGNAIDRTLFRMVTDFADFDFPDFIMDRWPVFNVADSCITIGVAILAFMVIFRRETPASSSTLEPNARYSEQSDSVSPDDRTRSTEATD